MNKILKYKNAKKNNEILEGVVVLTQHDEELDTDIIAMDLDGMKGIITRDELDYQVEWNSLVGFIGMKVGFVVKEIDEENGVIYCSRKEAQKIMEPIVIERLKSGEEAVASITGIVRYGAYMEIDGVYGLMENSDFSDDHVRMRDTMNVGDSIKVKMKNISENERITFEPVEKYVLEAVLKFDNFERNQVVLGKVNTIKPWGAFVAIAPGLDALCPIPETMEIEEGIDVSFRITQVQEDKGRVRGKILRVIQ